MDIKKEIKNNIINQIIQLELIKDNITIDLVQKYDFDLLENQYKKINNFNCDKEPFLYIIKTNSDLVLENVKNAKTKCKSNDFAMFKINENNFKIQQNNKEKVLYVGSSHNIKKRLIEHLGLGGSKKTYALHLKEWFYGQIKIEIYQTNEEYLQKFEDIIWDIYKPLLGRQGKK